MNLKGRHFLTLLDYSPQEIHALLDLSAKVKEEKKQGIFPQRLLHKNIALLFEKNSTRTRCAFTVAAIDEGAHPEFLGRNDIQFGKKESVADTARVLGRMFDGIQFRGFKHETVEALAKYAGVPVWNGLTDSYHPTQVLADLLTVREVFGRLKGIVFAYVGDGRNNMANSLMIGAAKTGMDFRIVAPSALFPDPALIETVRAIAAETGARITLCEDIETGVKAADVIYTDVWVSMGEESRFAERIQLLLPYQVNAAMMKKTGKADSIFLHCLPAFHDLQTGVGMDIYEKFGIPAMEVTDEVFESPASRVWDQAENRMHTIKAVMIATLAD
ncbi:MAG: ornithine carbamoyltransferase [Candidatus Marinimicrobia bacterium]|jgi:ornithine carbamoyltransferase|nr:ornithine carbamoyltransferase [Candidatus Neomarinimicrobiota bacterium]MDD4960648.1 ornithine carbamoyltransferase [Candidatus Neomarinimicrobiota bacterium]MDD5709847.1 ornithine carbamoyltransferase [Candidatus Neomarinimicrobiota bacterium]MDX9777537.1 ornithine carbamoyltransferase [bacterium]